MRFLLMLVLLCLATPATASADTSKVQNLHNAVRESTIIIPEIQDATEADADEMLCLALNIYHEARGGAPRDRWAVGFVTLNRVKRDTWGDTVCSVVWARSQFSWTVRGIGTQIPREAGAWADAQHKAHMLLTGQKVDDPTQGADHFYSARIKPHWARRLVNKLRIGAHIFARLPGS